MAKVELSAWLAVNAEAKRKNLISAKANFAGECGQFAEKFNAG